MGVLFFIIIIVLAYSYYHIMFGSSNAKLVRRLEKNASGDQKKVIDYFVRSSSIGRMLAKTISDEDYGKMVTDKVNSLNLYQKAISKIGIDEDEIKEIKPINLSGYSFSNAWSRQTESSQYVSSRFEAAWIFFSETQLHMYKYAFDMDQDWKNERTEEFFYQDVTSLSTTETDKKTKYIENGVQVERQVNSNVFQLVVPGDKMHVAINSGHYEAAEESVQGMKQMLREKKTELNHA